MAVNQLFFFEGLSRTTPVHAALMMLTTPILVVILASFILREKFTWNKGLGIALGLIAAALLISMGASSALGSNPALGDFFVFINAFILIFVFYSSNNCNTVLINCFYSKAYISNSF